jgi:hypothetical protein
MQTVWINQQRSVSQTTKHISGRINDSGKQSKTKENA